MIFCKNRFCYRTCILILSFHLLWFLFAGIRVDVKRMDRTPGKDQFKCDQRASRGADFPRAVSEYFSQLVRNVFISVMSCHRLGTFHELLTVWQTENYSARGKQFWRYQCPVSIVKNPFWSQIKAFQGVSCCKIMFIRNRPCLFYHNCFKSSYFHDKHREEHWMDATSSQVCSCSSGIALWFRSRASFVRLKPGGGYSLNQSVGVCR